MTTDGEEALAAYRAAADALGEQYREAAAKVDALPTNDRFRTSIHGADHSKKVLLFALMIADRMGLSQQDRETLATAAIYHDTQREDDWLDTGHGARAARAYRTMTAAAGEAPDELAALIMKYHDLDDEAGDEVIAKAYGERGVRLFHVFKDADGLDRFRLGGDGPDPRYLRSDQALSLLDTARLISGAHL